VAEKAFNPRFFWQAFFYPAYLTGVYLILGTSVVAARCVQAVLGAVTCALLYRLGKLVFDDRTGLVGGLFTACCGPLIFFETDLVAAGWAGFWAVILVLLLVDARTPVSGWRCLIVGACGAAAVLTRPTFVPFVACAGAWLAWKVLRRDGRFGTQAALGRCAMLLAGFVACAAPPAALCRVQTGRLTILPSSGGVNFYIGNHPDPCGMLTIRPGEDWDRLVQLPRAEGITDMWGQQAYFMDLAMRNIRQDPRAFLKGLGQKSLQMVCSRELPRNTDPYLARAWSAAYSVLVWKIAGFGFPAGVLIPLACVGLVANARRLPVPLILLLLLFPLAIILVFVSARYRAPMLPFFCLLAAAGLLHIWTAFRARSWARLIMPVTAAAAASLLSVLPGPFCEERQDLETEMYMGVASRMLSVGQHEQAIPMLARVLERAPAHADALANMANLMLMSRRFDEAISYYRAALERRPDEPTLLKGLGVALAKTSRHGEAVETYDRAILISPGDAQLRYNRGLSLLASGRVAEGIADLEDAVRLKPDLTPAQLALGRALRAMGREAEAVDRFREVLRREPGHPEALRELRVIQQEPR